MTPPAAVAPIASGRTSPTCGPATQKRQTEQGEDDLRRHLDGKVHHAGGYRQFQRRAGLCQKASADEVAPDLRHGQKRVGRLPHPPQGVQTPKRRSPAHIQQRAPAKGRKQSLRRMQGDHQQDAPTGRPQSTGDLAEIVSEQKDDGDDKAEKDADDGRAFHGTLIWSGRSRAWRCRERPKVKFQRRHAKCCCIGSLKRWG